MKKAQSALEYLVTYGWAILAIVIIAAVLWGFGIFDPSKWTENRGSGGFSAITIVDYTVGAGNSVTMVVGNKVGRTIMLTSCETPVNLTVTATDTQCVQVGVPAGNQLNIVLNYTDLTSGLTHSETGFVKYSG